MRLEIKEELKNKYNSKNLFQKPLDKSLKMVYDIYKVNSNSNNGLEE